MERDWEGDGRRRGRGGDGRGCGGRRWSSMKGSLLKGVLNGRSLLKRDFNGRVLFRRFHCKLKKKGGGGRPRKCEMMSPIGNVELCRCLHKLLLYYLKNNLKRNKKQMNSICPVTIFTDKKKKLSV